MTAEKSQYEAKLQDENNEKQALRLEMAQSNNFLFGSTILVLVMMLIWSEIAPYNKVVLLGTALPFVLARFDYLIQRVGKFFKDNSSTWERSDARNHYKQILGIADFGCLFPILAMWLYAEHQSFAAGNTLFVYGTCLLWTIGVATFIFAASKVRASKSNKQPTKKTTQAWTDPDGE